jgi:hypothetical protein
LTADNIFPVVTVQDPFKWMQSMCRVRSELASRREAPSNLVRNQVEIDKGWILPDNADGSKNNIDNVSGQIRGIHWYHTSLQISWNSWYQEYTKATFPKLIVRIRRPSLSSQTSVSHQNAPEAK